MFKEACITPFPTRCLIIGSWYVSQQRIHYQVILKHEFRVLNIKTRNDSYQLNPWWVEEALFSKRISSNLDYNSKTRVIVH